LQGIRINGVLQFFINAIMKTTRQFGNRVLQRLVSFLQFQSKNKVMRKKLNMVTIRYNPKKVLVSFRNQENLGILKNSFVRQYLTDLITKRGTLLELDLSGVRFIDSEGFDTLNILTRVGRKYDSSLMLKGVEKEVIEMINLAKRYYIFDVRHIEPALRA
jgi:anti-anti-sigma regulatory factor